MKNLIILGLIIFLPALCIGQQQVAYKKIKYDLESGLHDSNTDSNSKVNTYTVAFKEVIKVSDAAALRLIFSDYNLGKHSKIKIVSFADNNSQVFDQTALDNWRGKSAIFNGSKVEITLLKSIKDSGVYFSISNVLVGQVKSLEHEKSLCGADNRVAVVDARVARLPLNAAAGTSCTAWLGSNGAIITAGHCLDANGNIDPFVDIIEFNVPLSLADGTTVAAAPEDQYPIDLNSIVLGAPNGNLGEDWGVFRCFPNANGLSPHQAQGEFFRMTRESPNVNQNIRITGYGFDNGTANDTEQTNAGPYLGENSSGGGRFSHEYVVDTRGHNSGSPVIWDANQFTIGIHTNGGCNPPNNGNHGTSFEHNPIENALQNFHGNNTIYVDNISQAPNETGNIFAPFNTVQEGVNATIDNGRLYITTGTYNNSAGLMITDPIRIIPPATGRFVINP